jgi:hypothetical protein
MMILSAVLKNMRILLFLSASLSIWRKWNLLFSLNASLRHVLQEDEVWLVVTELKFNTSFEENYFFFLNASFVHTVLKKMNIFCPPECKVYNKHVFKWIFMLLLNASRVYMFWRRWDYIVLECRFYMVFNACAIT